jgi:hypothetical protein
MQVNGTPPCEIHAQCMPTHTSFCVCVASSSAWDLLTASQRAEPLHHDGSSQMHEASPLLKYCLNQISP